MTVGSTTTSYAYNALDQLTSAGTVTFDYDARGNMRHRTTGSNVTTYTYNSADQLANVTATGINATYAYDADGRRVKQTVGSAVTNYLWDEASAYDANGGLTEVLPNGNPASGAKRYTYNAAENLVQVEAHNGSSWNTQAEMNYNGLGQRLGMDAAGVIAHYVMDRDRPLSAETAGNTKFYLYGLGAIGEKTTAWNYSLPDGTNTPRQLSDVSGDIMLSARYTPWGDKLDTYGTGNFTFGYCGGVHDAATGLLYVGNGQYYDPATGRFLTRDARPNSTNPYVPWNPIGAIVGPLGIISLFYSRKKKGSKVGTFLVLPLAGAR